MKSGKKRSKSKDGRPESEAGKKSIWHAPVSVPRRDLRRAGLKRSAVIHPTSSALDSLFRFSVFF